MCMYTAFVRPDHHWVYILKRKVWFKGAESWAHYASPANVESSLPAGHDYSAFQQVPHVPLLPFAQGIDLRRRHPARAEGLDVFVHELVKLGLRVWTPPVPDVLAHHGLPAPDGALEPAFLFWGKIAVRRRARVHAARARCVLEMLVMSPAARRAHNGTRRRGMRVSNLSMLR